MLVSSDLFATTEFGAQEMLTQADRIKDFLFGPAMRFAGVLGGAYGAIQAVLSSSIRPFVAYGGIGMAVNLLPSFVNGVFGGGVAGALLP